MNRRPRRGQRQATGPFVPPSGSHNLMQVMTMNTIGQNHNAMVPNYSTSYFCVLCFIRITNKYKCRSSQNSFSYFEEIEKLPFLSKKYGVSLFDEKFTQVVNINNHIS
jgi:hypothetical protein